MIKNKKSETICADDYIHIHIIPSKNVDMLDKMYISYKYDGQYTSECKMNMEKTWRSFLVNDDKYKIISPDVFLAKIGNEYNDLKQYLSKRYWGKYN